MSRTPELQTNPTDMPMVKVAKSGIWVPAGADGGGNININNFNPTVSPKFEPKFEQKIEGGGIPPMIGGAVQPIYVRTGEPGAPGEPGQPRTPDQEPRNDDDEKQKKLDEMTKQLEDLKKKIEELEEAKKKHEEEIEALKKKNEELEQKNKDLTEENETLKARIKELENPPPPPGPTAEQLEEANANVAAARDRLAKVDIRRSARITDRFTTRRKEDAAEYEQAIVEYKQAMEALAQLMIAHERSAGKSEQEIRQGLIRFRYSESERYVNRVVEINDENFNNLTGWRKRTAMGMRRISDMSTRNKILFALGLGAGVGLASFMTGGGLAVLIAGGAMRSSWGLISHEASLRNATRHGLERQLKDIQKRRDEALNNPGTGDTDTYGTGIGSETETERRGNTKENIKKNRRGTAIMAGGLILTGLGVAHMAGADVIPDSSWLRLHWPFGQHHVNPNHVPPHSSGASGGGGDFPHQTTGGGPILPDGPRIEGAHQIDMSHFHPDEFKAKTPHEAVRGMFHVFERNHIRVRGDNNKAIAAIINDMKDHHWHIASGMADHAGHQNIVDVSQDWADGHTQNFQTSAEQGLRKINGSSVENWHKFMELAQRHGVKFIQRSR